MLLFLLGLFSLGLVAMACVPPSGLSGPGEDPVESGPIPDDVEVRDSTLDEPVSPGTTGSGLAGDDLAAGHLRWQTSNPGGGGAFAGVAIGPDGLLVAASDLSGAYISRDGGESWFVVGSAQGLMATHVSSIGLDPNDPDRVLLGVDGGLYESTDGGSSFEVVLDDGYVTAVAVADAGPSFEGPAAAYAAVNRTYDSSDTEIWRTSTGVFEPTNSNFPRDRVVLGLRVDPRDDQRILALTGVGRFASGPAEVWRSVDGGSTWDQIAGDLGPALDVGFAPSGPGSDRLVLAVSGGSGGEDLGESGALYLSDDGGQSWEYRHDSAGVLWIPAGRVDVIRFIDVEHQFPWDERQGVWESTDAGLSWERVGSVEDWDAGWSDAFWVFGPPFDGLAKTLAVDPTDPDRALWINSQFVFESQDGGQGFEQIFSDQHAAGFWRSRGFDNVVIADIEASQSDPDLWFIGYWDLGCFRSLDRGESWQNCNDQELGGSWEGAGGFMGTVLTDPERAGIVWAALGQDWETPVTMVRSEDSGNPTSWERTGRGPIGNDVFGLALDPTSSTEQRTLFVTVEGDVYRSVDDGWNWELVLVCGGCRTTLVTAEGMVVVGGESGLWRSEESGDSGTWNPVGLPTMSGDVHGPPPTYGWSGVTALATGIDGVLFATVFGDGDRDGVGLYRSKDGAETWDLVNPTAFAQTVAVDPRSGLVWLGSSSAFESGGFDEQSMGLQVSEDGGDTWQSVDADLPFPFVTHLAIGKNEMLVGSPGIGLSIGR